MYNTEEKRLFSEKVKRGLCSHAYIIDGLNGVGKKDFALFCAQAMLCNGIGDKPCNICNSCIKIQNDTHPDVFIVGAEKTASVDDVRELIRRASLKPNDSEKQIFIVCNAEKLRKEAQNALLKLFEEPPETVAMFLLTESRSALLPTILSRGQRIHLDGMSDAEIRSRLLEKFPKADKTDLETAVRNAHGNLGTAEKFFSKENVSLREKAEILLFYALSKKSYELMGALLFAKYKREQLYSLLSEFLLLVTEIQKYKYGVPYAALPKNSKTAEIAETASKRALARMGEAASSCMITLERNANITAAASKLAVELLSAATR